MNGRWLVFGAVLILAGVAPGQEHAGGEAKAPPGGALRLDKAQEAHDRAVAEAEQAFRQAVLRAKQEYLTQVKAALKSAFREENLEEAIRLDALRKRVETEVKAILSGQELKVGVPRPALLRRPDPGPKPVRAPLKKKEPPALPRPAPSRALVVYRPYVPKGEKEEVALSGAADDVAVGGEGRYLILRLTGKKKLAIFDVQQGKVVKELPLAEEGAHVAAGATQLVVLYPRAKLIQLWNLSTFERERSALFPAGIKGDDLHQVCMGSASAGPLFVHLRGEKRTLTLDLKSLTTTDVNWTHWSPSNAYGPLNMRAAPSGQVLVGWGGGWAGLDVAMFGDGRQIGTYPGIAFSGGAFALPSADGQWIYSASAIVNRTFSPVPMPGVRHPYLVPAVEPGYVLALQSTRELPLYGGGPSISLPPVDEVAVYNEDGQRLFNLLDLEELKKGSDLHWEKRLHYYPRAGLLLSLGTAKDRLILRHLDLVGQLEKSGADYLVVLSRPPQARAGQPFSYTLDIRSKKGGVKVELESGPKGLKATPGGLVSWDVPARPDEPWADVLLTLSDATGQKVLHAFTIEVTER